MKCFLYDCYNEATDTHEIFPGNNRNKSIEYKLQVRVCHACHMEKLTRVKRHMEYRQIICNHLGLDYDQLSFIMRKARPNWTEDENKFMDSVKEKMTEYHERIKDK